MKLQSTSSVHDEPPDLKHTNELVLSQLFTDALYPRGQSGIPLVHATTGQPGAPLEELDVPQILVAEPLEEDELLEEEELLTVTHVPLS